MSQENVENVRAGYEQFAATGDIGAVTADFVWDVSNLHWPDQQVYEGTEGAPNLPQTVGGRVGGLAI